MPPLPKARMSDGLVTLRAPEERDLDAIERGIHDPDVIDAFGHPTATAEQVLQLNRDRCTQGVGATFAICDADDRCLGHVFVNLSGERRGTIGYWLLPQARGQGLATRAVDLLAPWAFHELRLARLGLLAQPTNRSSRRVAERCGFRREGLLRSYAEIDGQRVDLVCFSLLPSDLTEQITRGVGANPI
jgi:ribosomal-protein-alanine N-acetyltransferase